MSLSLKMFSVGNLYDGWTVTSCQVPKLTTQNNSNEIDPLLFDNDISNNDRRLKWTINLKTVF